MRVFKSATKHFSSYLKLGKRSLNKRLTPRVSEILATIAAFFPGVLLSLVALAVIAAPSLVATLIATFFLFMGALLCFLGWKFLQMKRKFENLMKDFEGKVFIQTVTTPRNASFEQLASEPAKKILFH